MKKRSWIGAVLVAGFFANPLSADPPDRSIRPETRPQVTPQATQSSRPDHLVLVTQVPGVRKSPRPQVRPRDIRAGAQQSPSTAVVRAAAPVTSGSKRAICNKRSIRGENLSPIPGRLNGCGVQNPVRVFSVSGVALSQGAIMDCTTAKALDQWVSGSVVPTIGRLGGGVASLQVVAHYACRTRNSRPGAKISEHGKGHAIDISAVNLHNGISVTVLRGWRDRAQSKILRALHKAACGPFGTVLGPDSDRHHQDHFHFDTARYRAGSYCR